MNHISPPTDKEDRTNQSYTQSNGDGKSHALLQLRKFVAPEFIFGVGSLELAGRYGRNLGGRKALVVSDPGVKAAGWLQRVLASTEEAGLGSAVFTQVTPNPRMEEAGAGAAKYAEEGCDLIIAVGGGSVIDCGKAIGVLTANGGDLRDFVGVDKIASPMPPTICIPTTAGTSADVSQFDILTDRTIMRKLCIISKAVVPDISLIDPQTLTTLDPFLTACTGVDALVHAVEAYVSLGASPLTDIHALQAMRLIRSSLLNSVAEPLNLEHRTNMMLGSLEAGLAFSNASLGAVHAMSHSIGGLLDLPHGQCNAMLFDHVVDFNYPGAERRYDEVARTLGIDIRGLSTREVRKKIVDEIGRFRDAAGIRSRLGECGVHRTEVRELVKNTLDDPCLITNPRPAGKRDLEVIYEESL